jgi:hypothetical protein
MDIKKIMDVSSSVSSVNRREQEKSVELDFQRLLREAHQGQKSTSETTSSLPSHGQVEALSGPAFVLSTLEEFNQIRLQGVEATESALSLLEQYQKAIADPEISLKRIDPLVQSLSQEVNSLSILSERLSPSDPLQKILTEVGVVSTVEIEKFRRGDYV